MYAYFPFIKRFFRLRIINGVGGVCFLAVSLLLLNGCTVDYTKQLAKQSFMDIGLTERHSVERTANWRFGAMERLAVADFDRRSSVAYPLQSRTSKALYHQLLSQISLSFPHTQSIYASDLSHMIFDARQSGAKVLLVPTIMNYKNALNDWNELKEGQHIHSPADYGLDELTLQLQVYDTVGGKLVDVVKIHSVSARFDLQPGQVSDLFKPGIDHYLQAISAY